MKQPSQTEMVLETASVQDISNIPLFMYICFLDDGPLPQFLKYLNTSVCYDTMTVARCDALGGTSVIGEIFWPDQGECCVLHKDNVQLVTEMNDTSRHFQMYWPISWAQGKHTCGRIKMPVPPPSEGKKSLSMSRWLCQAHGRRT